LGIGLVYDAIVVGGGPAGLSAALQLARFNRQVAIFDSGMGRSTYHQVTNNYPGFPGGVTARELRRLAREQLRMYPVAFIDEAVTAARKDGDRFIVQGASGKETSGRSVVFATGVKDHFPDFPMWESYVGRSVFWCIVCDGYSTRGKRIVVVGNEDEAAVTAMQFLQFTSRVTMLTNDTECNITPARLKLLNEHRISVIEDEIDGLLGNDGILGAVELKSGEPIVADYLFSLQGCTPNSTLAASLGADCREDGYVEVNDDQQTKVPGVFAAGDVTGHLSHQVATAVHEGITAATAAQYFLYEPWQRHEP
jgi:thioredoxin reductase (NADPH)